MKKIGKLAVLVLILAVAVSMFAACSEEKNENGNGQQGEVKTDPTEEIKAVVDDYMKAYTGFDMEDAMKFVDKDSDLYETLEKNSKANEEAKKQAEKMGLSEKQCETFADMMTDTMKKKVESIECNIDEVKIDDDGKSAVVKCSGKQIDEESYDLTAEYEKALADLKLENDLKQVEKELDENEESTSEESTAQENELVIKAWEAAFNNVVKTWETEDVEKEITMELIDNEWKITEVETK